MLAYIAQQRTTYSQRQQTQQRFSLLAARGAICILSLFAMPLIAQTPTIEKVESVGAVLPIDAYAVGRTEETPDRMYVYQWPGIYFLAAYKGSAFYFTVGKGRQHVHITVDDRGLPPLISEEPATYRIQTPGKSAHSVRVELFNENQDGPKSIGAFSVSSGGKGILVTPKRRQIELIGDSYTVGAGNTSAVRECNADQTWLATDTTQSFGADLAQHYDADYQINAISGHGAIRNYNGFAGDSVPAAYPFTFRDKKHKYADVNWKPEVIVLSLGTNDFSTPPHAGEPWKTREELSVDYEKASVDFVKQLRQQNPKALIVLWSTDTVRGIVAAEVQKVVEKLHLDGENRVDFVNVPNVSFNGCLSHPTVVDDHLIADTISKDIDTHADVWH